ncbi:beta-1,3-galactosyl-O-glycosyl-glycoprotein beta-1,6-N-acetylglucosaminyltransferase 7-like [Rhinophrynus dorsalis]
MTQLCASKSGFLLCIGVCIFLFARNSFNDSNKQNDFIPEIKECGFYPAELCGALFEGKAAALGIGNICQVALPPSRDLGPPCLQSPTNCSKIIQELHFITKPLSREEASFPLAYILTIHKKLDMFVKLLRAIYVPQNIYCIHIDRKSPKAYSQAVQKLAGCFQNIIISSKQESVVYAGFSRLQADINCMEDLIHSDIKWNYVINLCGQDFPIKTNREIVQYLKSKWSGRNLTPGVVQPPHMKYRTSVSYREFLHLEMSYIYPTKTLKTSPPHNLTLFFGTAYYALTRGFVQFVLSDKRAKDLLEWSKDTYSPDEHYWVTLNRLKDVPGSTPKAQWEGNIRAIKWRDQEGSTHTGCHGHYVRDICVYGLGDLQWLTQSPHLFANKFDPGQYPLVTDCLERHYRLKVLQQAEVALEPQWYFHNDYTKKMINV